MADEAKAFCPGCGHSFVDEKQRETVSDFDQSNRTVQLGETMFNQMLSDMGLNISNPPNRQEIKSNLVAPIDPQAISPSAKQKTQPPPSAPAKRNRKAFWIVVIVLAAIVFAIVVMLITVAGLSYYYR